MADKDSSGAIPVVGTLLTKESSRAPRSGQRSQARIVWDQFRRHKLALASILLLLLLFTVALFAKVIMPWDPLAIDLALSKGTPQPPSAQHWLGTDEYGRDVLSRAISGARISLSVGFVAVGISLCLGVVIGSISGYCRGRTDSFVMRVTDIFLSLPSFFLILTANAYLPPSIYNIMVIIGVFGWMTIARLVRGEFLRLKEQEFIAAARVIGVPPLRMVSRHLLPNSVAPVIVAATLAIPGAILTESALSYLGLGVPPPAASWGSMLNGAKRWLGDAWWMWIPPGLLISLTVLAFNFVGDGLRDALDPLQRR